MKTLTRLLFETSPLNPFWSAFFAGYVVIGPDGGMYLTRSGQEYLEQIA